MECAPPAQAGTAAELASRAQEHYKEATRLYNVAEYERAVEEFNASFCLFPTPEAAKNVGQSYYSLLDFEKAILWWEYFVFIVRASQPQQASLYSSRIDRLRKLQAAGLALSAAGVVAVVLGSGRDLVFGDAALLGNVLTLTAACAWAVFTVFNRPLLASGLAPLGVTFYGVLAALPVLTAFGIPHLAEVEWSRVGVAEWGAIIFSGALSTGLAYALWNIAVNAVGPARTAAFNNLVPFVALATGYFLLREPITAIQLAGGALIIGGLYLVRRR